MRRLAPCLVAAALLATGCGSNNDSSGAKAPASSQAAASGAGSQQSAAVSAVGALTPASLCTPEGRGKPKKQCVGGLKKLGKGQAANPRAACKGLSKKKTKGVKGKSPFAVCVSAAAKLMAATNRSKAGNGAADNSADAGAGDDTSTDSADSSGADDSGDEPTCFDAKGNQVPIDSDAVEECDTDSTPSASDSSSDSSTDDTSTDDTSTDDGN